MQFMFLLLLLQTG